MSTSISKDYYKEFPKVADGIENAQIKEERDTLFRDVYYKKVPKRVPISISVEASVMLEFAGYDLKKDQFNVEIEKDAASKFASVFDSDISPVAAQKPYIAYKILGSIHHMPGDEGVLQHANHTYSEPEDYPEYIKDPYSYMVNTLLPRKHKNLNGTPMENANTLLRAYMAQNTYNAEMNAAIGAINKKYNYSTFNKSAGRTLAPFDFVADIIRSFPGVLVDMKRCPELLLEAVNATTEYKKFRVDRMTVNGEGVSTRIPFHMPTFMKRKDFEKFFWPSFYDMASYIVNSGRNMTITLEDNWSHLLDYAYEIPGRNILSIEKSDDLSDLKKVVGGKHILKGGFPSEYYRYGTKEEITDAVKKFLDIMAPGGGYIFAPNKTPLRLSDINPENYFTINDTVKNYSLK